MKHSPCSQPLDLQMLKEYIEELFGNIEERIAGIEKCVGDTRDECKQFNENTDKAFSVFVESISTKLTSFEETKITPLNDYKTQLNESLQNLENEISAIRDNHNSKTDQLFNDFKTALETYINYVNSRFEQITNT